MNRENKEAAERIRKQKESKKILEDYETSEAKLREKLKPKSTTSLDDEIKQAYDKAVKEDKFKNVRLRDGRKIEVGVAQAGKKDYLMFITGMVGLLSFIFVIYATVYVPSVLDNDLFVHLMGMIEGVVVSNLFAYYFGTSMKDSK